MLKKFLPFLCLLEDRYIVLHLNDLCVITLKGDAKFKGKLTRGLKNDIRNLVNFHASSRKSENLHFGVLLLSKAYYV